MSAADPVPLFAALGEPTRLALLERLGPGGPLSIRALSSGLPVSRQAVTKHLEVLAGAGLVRSFRRGRECLWQVRPAGLEAARAHLDRIAGQWDEALERLRRFVEEGPAGLDLH